MTNEQRKHKIKIAFEAVTKLGCYDKSWQPIRWKEDHKPKVYDVSTGHTDSVYVNPDCGTPIRSDRWFKEKYLLLCDEFIEKWYQVWCNHDPNSAPRLLTNETRKQLLDSITIGYDVNDEVSGINEDFHCYLDKSTYQYAIHGVLEGDRVLYLTFDQGPSGAIHECMAVDQDLQSNEKLEPATPELMAKIDKHLVATAKTHVKNIELLLGEIVHD